MKRKILLFMLAWLIASLSFGQLLTEKFNQVTPDTNINLPGWKNIAQSGTVLFQGKYDSADSNYFAQITATGSGEISNVSWLITPRYYVSPGNALNFRSKSGFTNADVFSLWISTNFTGNYSTATWTELSFVEPTDNGSSFGNWQNSGYINLEAYAGSNITIAFKYTGGDPSATTVWQIDDVVITNKPYAVTNPTSLSFTVASGSSVSGSFMLSNFGGGSLNFNQNSKSFSKADYSNWNLPLNQLRLPHNIWITRKNSQGIFNIAQEPGYSYDPSPAGTLWAYGLTKNLKPEDYDVWAEAVNYDPPQQVGNPISMNIIGTSIYYDIVFQSWTEGANGGGFSLNYSIYQPEWLVISTHSGNLNSGNSVNVNVTIDATNLYQGTYNTQVAFYTNDPDKPLIFIPIEVIVTGEPNIFTNIYTYNFGDVFVNGTKTYQLEVINNGRDTLMIDNVSSNNTAFSFDDTTFQILPDTSYLLSLHFAPLALQAYNGILSIHSNDPDQNKLNITLNGQGVAPPEFSITPDSLYVSVYGCNSIENRLVTISNPGGNNLNWEILPGLGIPCNKSILVIQDKDEWNVWMNTFIENEFGITPDLINSSQIGATNFMNYDIIVTCGDQSSGYYQAITDNRSKFEAFVNAGGVVQYQLATQGDDVTIVGGVEVIDGNRENFNTILIPNHPITSGLPLNLEGDNANHTYLQNLPANASILIETQSSHVPTMAEYDYGNGKVIVTGMTLGYLYDNGFNSAPLLHNVCAYSLSLIGSIPGWMTLTPLNGTVAPGNNMNVNIAINTTNLESGVYPVQLKFETNDPANPMFEMPVYLDYHTIPVIAANNDSIDFKNIAVGGQETKMLHIINSGCDTLIVDSMIHNLPEFIVNAIIPSVILPGNHLEIPVIFEPLAMINYTDTLQIFNNDTLIHVFLFGSGSDAPVITVNPDTFYTSVNGCNNLINQPITISNITGAANLNFELYLATDSSLIISGTILPGEDSLIQIPINTEGLNSGLYINNYIIHSNDTINPDVSVTGFITINGEPIIFTSTEHLDYGSILINSDSIQSFYIKNLGCDTLEIIDINTSLIEFSLQDTAFIIYPNDSVFVTVTFKPTAAIGYLDTFNIISNDTNNYVILTGTGLAVPVITVVPDTINVTINGCNTIQTTNFTIYNTGESSLEWAIPESLAGTLNTIMAGGNSQDGNMFDIYAENTVQINSFDINAEDTGPYSMEIYYKNGSYVGHQSNPASWTLIGAYNVMSNGEYNYTPVVLNTPLLLNQGETYGIYVTTTGANSLSYTNGANVYSDDNITVTTGVGKEYPFGSTFTPRTWNGRINYSIGITWATCVPDSGEVASGDSTIVAMTIDPTGLTSGVYNNFLPVVSNDPEMNMYNVPVNLTLIGQPEIILPVANYDFQSVIVNTIKNQEFKIYNSGCDSLSITNIISSIPEFFTYDTNLTILPFDSASIHVTFAPSDTGQFNGILTIENNDTVIYLVLSGQGINAPELFLNPTSFNIIANGCDVVIIDTLHIANQGLSPLNWRFENNSIINGDFETGNYLPWSLNPDHTASVVPEEPGSANHILSLTGGNMTAYNGIKQTFAPVTPNHVSYKIKPSNAPPHGVFTIGDETMSANDGIFFQYFDGTNIFINGITLPYNPNEWYVFDIKNIDYINHTFDFYVNGNPAFIGLAFTYNCNYVSEVQLFNGFNTTSYYDDIKVGGVPTWIGLSNTSGTTDTSSISDVLLTINTIGMNDGVYNSGINLLSNDTANPNVFIPITLTVNGIAQISLSDTTIDFGQVYTGSTHTMELTIYNDGCDTLEITDIISDTAVFSPVLTVYNILPGNHQVLQINFAPGVIGNYSGNLTIVNNDTQQNIVLTGEGVAPGTPIIIANKGQINFEDVYIGEISNEQIYTVSAQSLTEDLVITAPYGFQISEISGNNFGYNIVLYQSGGTVSATDIYVRFTPTMHQNYIDTLVHVSSGAVQRNIKLTGNGLVQPEMIVSTPSLDFGSVYNGFESDESSYTIAGSGLTQDLNILAPTDFVISLTSGSGFTDELNFTPVNGIVPTTPVYVKFVPQTVKGYNDNILHASIGAPNLLLHVTGTSLENYLVTFNVSDGVNPISGASILINGDTLTTSGSGVATINLLTGNYNYTVTAIGYNNYSSNINVVNQNITEDISMVLTTYDVTFNVSDGTNPISGAVIALTGYGNQTTDSTGIVVFTGVVPANNIAYTVTATGYDNVTGSVDVTNASITENVTMDLTTYSVTFNVSDGANPIVGATVTLTGYGNQTTNGSGVAIFNNVLPDNDITYSITAAGYNVYNDSLNVISSNVTENITLTLTTYSVTFNVGDGTGPLSGATVTLNGYGSATTTVGGVAVFNNVVPSPAPGIGWTVSLSGYGPQTGNIIVDGNETVNVTLNNTIYDVIFNVYNDITGNPWVGIPVEVINEGTENTDVNGIAEFNLYGGTYNYAIKFASDTIEDNFTVPVSDTIEIAYHVGINEIGNVSFTVYPNPAKDNISISADETIHQIKIMDINGVLVKAIECNERIVNIGISELASGNYFITVKTNNGKGLQKIQVRK